MTLLCISYFIANRWDNNSWILSVTRSSPYVFQVFEEHLVRVLCASSGRSITIWHLLSVLPSPPAPAPGCLRLRSFCKCLIPWWLGPAQVVLVVKKLPANAGNIRDMGPIPESGRSSGEGHGNPLQYSCLGNSMDREAWGLPAIHGMAKGWTWLKWLSTQHWWLRKEPACSAGGHLQCKGPGFNPWVRKISWRRKWLPTPVVLPGKSHGQRSLAGNSPWGCKESDMT